MKLSSSRSFVDCYPFGIRVRLVIPKVASVATVSRKKVYDLNNKILDDEMELSGTVHRVKARGLGVLRAFCVM